MKSYNEYKRIKKEFDNIEEYRTMKGIFHHGTSRKDHMKRVALLSFYISSFLHLDYVSTTRGAFLHDFFTEEEVDKNDYRHYLKSHPYVALDNSRKYFNINVKEEDIIKKHMYPLTLSLPKYKETVVVSISDKIVSVYECIRYEFSFSMSLLIIFMFNFLD